MAKLDGYSLLDIMFSRLATLFPDVGICVIAPEYDRGNLDNYAASYSHDASPLDRMRDAVLGLPDDAIILHMVGHHSFFVPEILAQLLDGIGGNDLAKLGDDYPPALAGDVWRVGALRNLHCPPGPHQIHPKFLAARRVKTFTLEPTVPDAVLRSIRANYAQALVEDFNEVTDKAIPAGDQISYHYKLAARQIDPDDTVLDVAGGIGTGAAFLARTAKTVICCDLDWDKLARGPSLPNLIYQVGDICALPFMDNRFNAATSMETLEHVERPEQALSELRRVLKPGGRLILSTPQNRLGHIPLTPAHVHEFSGSELVALCARFFTVEDVIGLKGGTIWFEDDPAGANTMLILRKPVTPIY
jgi:SAM-dependent methyltransferase